MKITKKILLFLVLVSAGFAFGIAIEHGKFNPYYQVLEVYERNIVKAQKMLGMETAKPAKTVIVNTEWNIPKRKIPSALLPLSISGVQLNAKFNVPVTGGGIAVVNDKVIIADRLDQFHVYDPKENVARPAGYPPLPSYREAFFNWGKYGRSEFFRLHDIEYADVGGKGYLIASHEFFDTKLMLTRLAVHRLRIDPNNLSSIGDWVRIFASTPLPHHKDFTAQGAGYTAQGAGGRLTVDGGSVYLTVGDYAQDGVQIQMQPPFPAQITTSDFGSIFKLNIQTGERETISYGHRNPQGLMMSANGELISTEHGPRGGDELNIIKSGRNYGWPEVTLGTHYPSYSWPSNKKQGRHDGFEAPIYSWVLSIGVSNLIEVREFNDRWDGDLLVSSLKAASLYRLRREGEKVIYSEPIWIGQRIRDLAQLPNGTIVIWTDQTQLLFLSVDEEQLAGDKFAGIPTTVGIRLEKCLKCHHMGDTNPSHPAPSLSNLVGRAVASDKQFKKYTNAMKQLGGIWTRNRLTNFLNDPTGFAPGSNMGMAPMTDLRNIRHLIDELERAK